MTDETANLILEILRAIRGDQAAMRAKVNNFADRMRGLEIRFGALESRFALVEERMAGIEARLDRIETRLGLIEA